MGWFLRKKEAQAEQMQLAVRGSFDAVKRDTHALFQWVGFLYHKNQEQEHLIADLQAQVRYLPKTREELKQLIDMHYSIEPVLQKIEAMREKVHALEQSQHRLQQSVQAPVQQPIQRVYVAPEEKPKAARERLVQKLAKTSKEHVKSVIFNLIRKYGTVSALQLREIIVEEQGLASKSSFYRMLEELEQEGEVLVTRDKKEKKYQYAPGKQLHN